MVVMFEYVDEEDREQIIDMSPWSVQGHYLCMKKWMPSVGLAHVDFKKVQFLVQVHDLGLEKFSSENATVIGEKNGDFIETEENVESAYKTYTWMK